MENKEIVSSQVNKVTETLTKELESLSDDGLYEFFKFVYRMNHSQGNMIDTSKFEEFLETFDSNPFKINSDKKFRKQLIENLIDYAYDHMSLITAAVLIKRRFTIDEIISNYYSSVNAFDNNLF